MLSTLFSSSIRAKILKLFFNHPYNSYYIREIALKIDNNHEAVRKELENLELLGVVQSNIKGNRKHFYPNPRFELYKELRSLILKAGLRSQAEIFDKMKRISGLRFSCITGFFTNNKKAGVDILFVLESKQEDEESKKFVKYLEKELKKEINYALMDLKEFRYRENVQDKFLMNILEGEHIVIVDRL